MDKNGLKMVRITTNLLFLWKKWMINKNALKTLSEEKGDKSEKKNNTLKPKVLRKNSIYKDIAEPKIVTKILDMGFI